MGGAVADIRLAAASSGIATLSDARQTLGKAAELLHTAYDALANASLYVLDAGGVDESDDTVTLRAAEKSLLDQANAYAQKIYGLVNIGDGPIDQHTQEQVVAALKLAKEAFEHVQSDLADPSLQIDFTSVVMASVDLATSGVTTIAKAVGAGAAQAFVSLWYIAIPGTALLGWYAWNRISKKGRT
jgi:hypothetical protein